MRAGTRAARRLSQWYTYRTPVAVLLGSLIAAAMFVLYHQEQTCEAREPGCVVDVSLHPEDRLLPTADPPAAGVVVLGIDDRSIGELGHFPFTRDRYATVLDNLAAAKAAVAVFDVGFTEDFTADGDAAFRRAIAGDNLPVVLAYGHSDLTVGDHRLVMTGEDQHPLARFTCGDDNPVIRGCHRIIAEVGTTALVAGSDGAARRLPMFVEPRCHVLGTCDTEVINPISLVAYRDLLAGAEQGATLPLQLTTGGAALGQAWRKPLPVDDYGLALINYSGAPGNIVTQHHYYSFADVYSRRVEPSQLAGKVVLIGAYDATGLHDELAVPTGAGRPMAGVEINANVITMLLNQSFVRPEPALWVGLSLIALCVVMALLLARLSVLGGLGSALAGTGAFTVTMVLLNSSAGVVPDLFHVWLGTGLVYTSGTAYRFFVEERQRQKVTNLFGQYLKPEIVRDLAAARSIDELPLGGSRRDISVLFVDIRGFTAMSESMSAEEVVRVLDIYLEDLSRIVFNWDGTLDKYVGDEIMAMWNAPHAHADHALRAVRAGWEMLNHTRELQDKLEAAGLPRINFGIGVNTGPAVVGIMGSSVRQQYTAIGDTVNTGARFCGVAAAWELLIGEATYAAVREYVDVQVLSGLSLKGLTPGSFRVFRVTAMAETPEGAPVQLAAPEAEVPAAEIPRVVQSGKRFLVPDELSGRWDDSPPAS